jgi:hypothetical protein
VLRRILLLFCFLINPQLCASAKVIFINEENDCI